jgi:Tetrahydrofolate dehydrogenase/cyclohydrolase, NAD(P)-binding domain/Tetrahydrofolate dehydrogenase/cyclohydrolase, catalytic domain
LPGSPIWPSVGTYQRRLPEDAAQHEVLAEIARLNADPAVSGMLILRPVPAHIQEEDIFTAGASNIGKPAVSLAYDRQAAVDSVDEWASRTGQLGLYTRRADVLIVAAGVPGLIRAEHVRQGAIVLDVEHAAWAAARALLDPAAEGGQLWGPWFLRSKGAPALEQPTPAMTDRETAGRLWTLSGEATGVAWPLQTNLRKRGQSGAGESDDHAEPRQDPGERERAP